MENQEEERVGRMRGRHMAKGRGGAARHHDMRDDAMVSEPRQIVDRPQQVSEQPVEVISPEGVLNLKALKRAKVTELAQVARDFEVEGAVNMRKQEMIFAVLQAQAHRNGAILGEGVLEILPDGFGFLRSPRSEEHTSELQSP